MFSSPEDTGTPFGALKGGGGAASNGKGIPKANA